MALSKLNTLILTLSSGLRLAAPQAILAEVVPQQTMTQDDSSEDWLMGFLDWRGEQVPVIDPGVICGRAEPAAANIHRYGVLYALEHIVGLSYYALPLASVPHPVMVTADDVQAETLAESCPALAAQALIENQSVAIPDFPYLERLIEGHLSYL